MERNRTRTISRERIHEQLDAMLDYAERSGFWGRIGVSVLVQNGCRVTSEKQINETEKGEQLA